MNPTPTTYRPQHLGLRFAAIAACALGVSMLASNPAHKTGVDPGPHGFLYRTNYHGWRDSILVSNGRVEVVIVPALGRIMQFRLAGAADGAFWENPALAGRTPDPSAKEWLNFGGDKSWPAPQSDWEKTTHRAWPPPTGFDAMPNEALIDGFDVTLVSPVDPHYGIRVRRQIELDIDRPVMNVTTTYEKVAGRPVEVSVWVISQFKDPVGVYAVLPTTSIFRNGYQRQTDELPANLMSGRGLISLTRDPKSARKIGTDSGTLIWLGRKELVRIDSARQSASRYPDRESSAEIYTNPDPLAYVELEMLGPLHRMIVGDKISRVSIYTLLPRTEIDPDLEIQKLISD